MGQSSLLRLRLRSTDLGALEAGENLLRLHWPKKKSSSSFSLEGPIYLPTKRKLFTVNRSHHVHKKSRDQFSIQVHQRLWRIRGGKSLEEEGLRALHLLGKVEGLSLDWSFQRTREVPLVQWLERRFFVAATRVRFS